MGNQIPQQPYNPNIVNGDIAYNRKSTGDLDYHTFRSDLARFYLRESDYSPLTTLLTGNHTVVVTEQRNQFLSVTTGTSEITITFPVLADDTAIGSRIVIYNTDNTAGVVKISGVGSDFFLGYGESVIIEAQTLDSGPTYGWVITNPAFKVSKFFQNDVGSSQTIPANNILYEFNSPSLFDSEGTSPISSRCIGFIPFDNPKSLYSNKGCIQSNAACHIQYAYTWGSKATFKMWIRPSFTYTTTEAIVLVESRSGIAETTFFLFRYENTADVFQLIVRDDGANDIVITSDAFTSDVDLQKWHSIVLTYDVANNDDADGKGNAQFFLNGVEQGTTEGTKTKQGTGIANFVFPVGSVELTLLARHADDTFTGHYNGLITGLMREDDWNEDTTGYDATQPPVSFWDSKNLPTINRNSIIDGYGNIAARGGRIEQLDSVIGNMDTLITDTIAGREDGLSITGDLEVGSITTTDGIDTGGGLFKEILITMGPVNFNSTTQFLFPHPGVDATKIVSINTMVNADTGNFTITIPGTGLGSGPEEGHVYIQGSYTVLNIPSGGYFNTQSNFSGTTVNRGYILIKYFE